MNREADICSALIHNRKLRLFDAVAEVVGISERELADQVARLCADGTLRRERDYLLIANEPKAKAVAKRAPKVENSAAEDRVAARMAANAKAAQPACPVMPVPPPTRLLREHQNPDAVNRDQAPTAKPTIVPVSAEALIERAPAPKPPAPAKPNVVASGIPIPAHIVVDYGIPIPSKRLGKVGTLNPFHEQFSTMKVGGSFEIPVPKGFKHRAIAELLRKSAYQFRRVLPGLSVTIRTSEDGKTVRLWRDPDETVKETPARSSNGIRLPIAKRPGATARA